jgi:oligopeptide/dipeptide ABC transporter ATP-binding protein
MSVLEVEDLWVEFQGRGGRSLPALRGVTFDLGRGETIALVGESGSGKTMVALSLLGLVPSGGRITRGAIRLEGRDLVTCSDREMRGIRGARMAMVFQDAMTAFNPVRTIGSSMVEAVRLADGCSRAEAKERAIASLRAAGVPSAAERFGAYPHQLSGGLRQRSMIAMALVNDPLLVVADEPTTALDATIQAQVLELLRSRLADNALIMITHDLGVAAEIADRIVVMYAGRVVETGTVDEILDHPRHPYTVGLLSAVPRFEPERRRLTSIPGLPPRLGDDIGGCPFGPRCDRAGDDCTTWPELIHREGRAVACWRPHV